MSWINMAIICIIYGGGATIAAKLYSKRYARTLGLSSKEQFQKLSEAFKTGAIPNDKEISSALPIYVERRAKLLKRRQKTMPANVILMGSMLLLSILEHDVFGTLVFSFFMALSIYSYYSSDKYAHRIAALQTELKDRGVQASDAVTKRNEQWNETISRTKNAGWIVGALLFLGLIMLLSSAPLRSNTSAPSATDNAAQTSSSGQITMNDPVQQTDTNVVLVAPPQYTITVQDDPTRTTN